LGPAVSLGGGGAKGPGCPGGARAAMSVRSEEEDVRRHRARGPDGPAPEDSLCRASAILVVREVQQPDGSIGAPHDDLRGSGPEIEGFLLNSPRQDEQALPLAPFPDDE